MRIIDSVHIGPHRVYLAEETGEHPAVLFVDHDPWRIRLCVDSAGSMGRALANALPRILDALDSEELHGFLHRIAEARLRQVDLSGVVHPLVFFGAIALMGLGNGMVLPNAKANLW